MIPNNFFDIYLTMISTMLKIEEHSKFLKSDEFKEYYVLYGEVLMKKPVESKLWENVESDDEDEDF